jgi:hypothetical protein
MDQKVITLIISIVAILATLISSLIGHYFTAKARTSSFKQMLYGKQVDLLIQVIHKQGRFKIFATLLLPGAEEYAERAHGEIIENLKEYSILTEEAAAIITTEIWIAIRDCSSAMGDFVEKYDKGELTSQDDMLPYTAIDTKVTLMIRSFIGADKLSDESVKLFSTKKDLKRITEMNLSAFEEFARQKNKKK